LSTATPEQTAGPGPDPTSDERPRAAVVRCEEVRPVVGEGGVRVRPTLGRASGFTALEQEILECPPAARVREQAADCERTLFVLSGRGWLSAGGSEHSLEPEVGVLIPPGTEFELRADQGAALRLVSVRIPDPAPAAPGRASAAPAPAGPVVSRLADSEAQPATARREFRILADPACGLRSATHFVGYIPPQRAPDHYHTYDEVIHVLEGEGAFHCDGRSWPVAGGTCIQLPARTVHCLENTGGSPMRVVAVFRPAGSPAAAFYPDGTPAFSAAGEPRGAGARPGAGGAAAAPDREDQAQGQRTDRGGGVTV